MSAAQQQQLYELWKKVRLIKGKKTPESSRALTKTDNSSHENLFADETPKANNRKFPALNRKGSRTRQSHADT